MLGTDERVVHKKSGQMATEWLTITRISSLDFIEPTRMWKSLHDEVLDHGKIVKSISSAQTRFDCVLYWMI
jgi:hypothetical protein